MPKHFAEKYIPCRIFIRQGFSFAEKSCKIKHKSVSFGLTRSPNLSLPLGKMSRSDREGWVLLLRAAQTCLSLWDRCRAATERACISYILSPVCLIRIGSRAALSVICFANASSPKGRAEKPVQAESLTNQGDFDTDLFVCCSFRHGLRRATFLREEGFGFPRKPNLSLPLGEMSRSDREGRLPCEGAGFAAGKD